MATKTDTIHIKINIADMQNKSLFEQVYQEYKDLPKDKLSEAVEQYVSEYFSKVNKLLGIDLGDLSGLISYTSRNIEDQIKFKDLTFYEALLDNCGNKFKDKMENIKVYVDFLNNVPKERWQQIIKSILSFWGHKNSNIVFNVAYTEYQKRNRIQETSYKSRPKTIKQDIRSLENAKDVLIKLAFFSSDEILKLILGIEKTITELKKIPNEATQYKQAYYKDKPIQTKEELTQQIKDTLNYTDKMLPQQQSKKYTLQIKELIDKI